jgi:hypothetical protein
MVDEARVREIRDRASQAMGDMDTAGMIGLAAIRSCARAHEQLERLDAAKAKATLDALRATKRELDMLEQALSQHRLAFAQAFGRTQTAVESVVHDLAALLGEKP